VTVDVLRTSERRAGRSKVELPSKVPAAFQNQTVPATPSLPVFCRTSTVTCELELLKRGTRYVVSYARSRY
jgi:hypothetical protein